MTSKELKQLIEVAMAAAELKAENKILKDINEKLMQALRIHDVVGQSTHDVVGQSEQSVCECKSEWIEHIDNFSDRMRCKMCGKSF